MRLQLLPETLAHPVLGLVCALRGDTQGALRYVELTRESRKPFGHLHHGEYDIACVHALCGDRSSAVEWLSRAARDGYPCQPFFEADPLLRSLHGHAGFERLMAALREERAGHARVYEQLRP